ncbi:hypothetical protein OIU79_027724 [Salix purpurea]|uniref:Uncharacterized protein n=1 Tax=Salix purpurea TaxID=77065 RepID=A0A9Q0VUD7_SALPP|nr:hypothetical protein OIU79_027724 [Salix purpurea]
MEPRTVFIPRYIYSSLILFICQGNSDELAERRLKFGDIYRIPDGSTFYLMKTDGGRDLTLFAALIHPRVWDWVFSRYIISKRTRGIFSHCILRATQFCSWRLRVQHGSSKDYLWLKSDFGEVIGTKAKPVDKIPSTEGAR